VEGGADQTLLRAVVQVTFDALSLGVGGGDDPPAGRLALRSARRVAGVSSANESTESS
jgi:hypothetical protein